ncbi:MAG: DNA polymerase [Candidatus Acidiferrales bacterium]
MRTLAFALTDESYSLESACEVFGVEHRKAKASRHGEITEEYIDYNRRDVLATAELAVKLLEEYERHPIKLQATKAYSPASIGKAYLRAMGVAPILERQPHFPRKFLGYAQSAFFGGRTSAHIRKAPVPVVYVDFLSMYPTVNSLMNLWRFVMAEQIKIVCHCQREIRSFLKRLTRAELFKPETWTRLPAFVKIIPNDDILPSRSQYSLQTNDWQVAVNYLYAKGSKRNDGLWYSLPDVAASVLLTGKVPRIVDGFRLEARGVRERLKAVKLRGAVRVDPRKQDFFRVVIEERKRASSRADLSETEERRLDKALKVLANAASYGIYAEMNRQESDKKVRVNCYGIDAKSFSCSVSHPDVPGEYCFPPLASLITGAARLMLALLESCVTEIGGTYAMEDTDSMAIVATKHGGLVACPGGPLRSRNDKEAITALSWLQVRKISEQFAALNPYKKTAIPGSILKIEEDNFDPKTHRQRQLYCLAISAKRYALFLLNRKREPVLLERGVNNRKDRWSEHGLGHLLNPSNPDSEDRDWIGQSWLMLIRRSLALTTKRHRFETLPAIGRITLSSPLVMRPFIAFNTGKPYADQIKPFNFLLTCHVAPLGHPVDCQPADFHLVSPFELNSKKWLGMEWLNLYTGKRYRITTVGHHGTRHAARVKTYGDVLSEYEFHPESKCADANGQICRRETLGLLQRRRVQIDAIKYIGKESNQLENVHAGLIHSEKSVYTEYTDARRDEWATKLLPVLRKPPLRVLVRKCRGRISRRALIEMRAGRSSPHRKNQEILRTVALTFD